MSRKSSRAKNKQCVIEECENLGTRNCDTFCFSQVCPYHYHRSQHCGNCDDDKTESETKDHSSANESNEDHFPANFVIDDRWKEKMGSHDPILILSELLALYETTAVDRDIILIMLGSDFENQHERAKTLGLDRTILRQKFNKIEDELDYIISKY